MKRKPFAVNRRIKLAMSWYGKEYSFYRKALNEYKEPEGTGQLVQKIIGIYHSSSRSFIELISNEGASVKSKFSRGIVCDRDNEISIQQNDYVTIEDSDYYVTAIEPVLYNDEVIAYEISIEELIEGNDA